MLHWDDMNISGDDVAVSALGLSNLWGSFVVVSIYKKPSRIPAALAAG